MPNKVLYIAIDGCRAEIFASCSTYAMNSVVPRSNYSFDSLTKIPISSPSWFSLFSGKDATCYNVHDNECTLDDYRTNLMQGKVEDICTACNKKANYTPSNDIPQVFCDRRWDRFAQIFHPSIQRTTVEDERPLLSMLSTSPDKECPPCLVYYNCRVDDAAHDHGFDLSNKFYKSAVKRNDTIIKRCVSLLKQREAVYDEKWLLVLLTDHGGSSTSDMLRSYSLQKRPKTRRKWLRKVDSLLHKFNNTTKSGGEHGISNLLSHSRCFQIYHEISQKKHTKTTGEILPPPSYRFPKWKGVDWVSS